MDMDMDVLDYTNQLLHCHSNRLIQIICCISFVLCAYVLRSNPRTKTNNTLTFLLSHTFNTNLKPTFIHSFIQSKTNMHLLHQLMHKCPSSSTSTSTLLWRAVPCPTHIPIHSIILLLSNHLIAHHSPPLNHKPSSITFYNTFSFNLSLSFPFSFIFYFMLRLLPDNCLLSVCVTWGERRYTNLCVVAVFCVFVGRLLQSPFIIQAFVNEVITRSVVLRYNAAVCILCK